MLPALNEEENLPLVLEGLPDVVDEVVVVDGGSADDTVAIAREVRPDAVVVRQTRSGKGNALVCGFAACTGDIVVTLNADGSTDPGEIPRFVDALLAGAEVAHGSRYRDGGGVFSADRLADAGNRSLSAVVNALFGTRFTDLSYGYNAFWRHLLPLLELPPADLPWYRRTARLWGDGPEIQPLINLRTAAQGLRVVEVASIGYPRIHGDRRPQRMRATGRALRAVTAEYLRRRRAGQVAAKDAGPRHRTQAAPAHAAPAQPAGALLRSAWVGQSGAAGPRPAPARRAAGDAFPDRNPLDHPARHNAANLVPGRHAMNRQPDGHRPGPAGRHTAERVRQEQPAPMSGRRAGVPAQSRTGVDEPGARSRQRSDQPPVQRPDQRPVWHAMVPAGSTAQGSAAAAGRTAGARHSDRIDVPPGSRTGGQRYRPTDDGSARPELTLIQGAGRHVRAGTPGRSTNDRGNGVRLRAVPGESYEPPAWS